ncbi:hypothetical protein BOX30_12115 [Leptospirillum ferriphilum]|uniref:Uncharacterized protein n=1 Tax=Leptospirillum ferriphilum TaxID=178606 RepID=A0A1V3SYL7_9BACT|nr:MAG: hypothetical protein UBAL2_82410115 [Leptospirillum rubarum]OOH75274.1 hypothetical protein BOX24_00205 [Leptospirillum ferriphilum]OOH75370.1 hypothetical protein BOX30_12115 [Leptospirillum ferriphilum]
MTFGISKSIIRGIYSQFFSAPEGSHDHDITPVLRGEDDFQITFITGPVAWMQGLGKGEL